MLKREAAECDACEGRGWHRELPGSGPVYKCLDCDGRGYCECYYCGERATAGLIERTRRAEWRCLTCHAAVLKETP